jgi:hypothetical protein
MAAGRFTRRRAGAKTGIPEVSQFDKVERIDLNALKVSART